MTIDVDELARGLLRTYRDCVPHVPPSEVLGRALTLDEAYAVQRAHVGLRLAGEANGDRIIGYKAAANAAALRERLQLDVPIVGALLAGGQRTDGSTVALTDFRSLLIETEFGFRTAREIEAPVKSLAELRNAVSSVMPMFELADPGFGRARMTGTDLVAANAASAAYVCGAPLPVTGVDMNACRVRLLKDGALLHDAEGRDLMGDQWQALFWLVNAVLAQGYAIEPGHLLMTGALGAAHPASAGRYAADFGALGALDIRVG
jgi:2-keto-4-pentenoate hydratase